MNRTKFKTIFSKVTTCTLKGIGILIITLQICLANEFVFDNKKISYTDASSGKPFVVIYAFPTDPETRQKDTKVFENHFRVITVDVSGLAQPTPTGDMDLSLDQCVDAVNALLVHLHIEHAIIGDKVKGGYIAEAFFKKYPQKVEGLVIEYPGPSKNAETNK